MKTKPWSLIILALLHVLAPIGNLFVNAFRSNRTLGQQWQYWFEILPKYFLLIYIVVPILAGIFIYVCRRWSYWAYLCCVGIIFISNIYAYWTLMQWQTLITLMLILSIDIVIVAYFIVPSVQSVYMNPRVRWWEALPRYNFNQEGFANGEKVTVKVLSQGGLFMTSSPSLKTDDKVECSWNFEGTNCKVSGIVIYQSNGGEHSGSGVRFEHTPETQKQMKLITEKLQERGMVVAERLPGPEDSFLAWFKKLLTSGEGLFPKLRG